jgi:signal transduction histidine kinase
MRARLLGVLVALMVCVLAALSVPFAERLASDQQQAMFLDRLQYTNRFASAAEQAGDTVDDQALQDDLIRYREVFGVAAAVIDRTATVLWGSGGIDTTDPAVAHAASLALSGHQSPNPGIIWPVGRAEIVVAVPVVRGDDVIGAALTISSTASLRHALGTKLELLALADLIALMLFVLLSSRLATWVLRPVYVLDSAARQISAGNLAARVGAAQGPVEIRRLGTSFNQMADAVERVLDRQQAFVADASHQLRNPLTAMTLRLESLALQLDGAEQDELADILADTGRLNTILSQMLELAAVQHALSTRASDVDAVVLVAARVASWRPSADQRKVTLDFRHPDTALVHLEPALASSIVDALLDNAIKFSPDGGQVTVVVATAPDAVSIEVADQGPGLKPAEFDRIGNRFWRSPKTAGVPGSGLGVSIARELSEVIGGTLRFSPVNPHGLRVVLRLPTAAPPAEDACGPGARLTP